MNISRAEFSISFIALIAQIYSYRSFITNSKTFSIVITIINSKTFSNSVYSLNSYSVSVGFGFDNSKAFDDGCFNSFEDGVISYDFNIIVIEV